MWTMVVINPNKSMFVNKPWILNPCSYWKTKNNVKLLVVDIYCTTNHVNTKKWASFQSKEEIALRRFTQSFFTLVYCWFIFRYIVELLVIFLCEHFVPLNVWGQFVTFRSTLRRTCHFAFPMQLQRGCLEILTFSNWGFLTSFLC